MYKAGTTQVSRNRDLRFSAWLPVAPRDWPRRRYPLHSRIVQGLGNRCPKLNKATMRRVGPMIYNTVRTSRIRLWSATAKCWNDRAALGYVTRSLPFGATAYVTASSRRSWWRRSKVMA